MAKIQDTSSLTCVFSSDRKKILLIKRRDVPVWVLPGGHIESNETPEEAAIRELKEETGFDTEVVKKIGEYSPINRLTRFTHLFECKIVSGKATISAESKEVEFFSLDSLPKMPIPYEDWINDAKANLPYIIKKKLSQVTYLQLLKNLFFHPVLVIRFLLSRIGLSINS
jgi:8-oxo-dGTP diphosphatase